MYYICIIQEFCYSTMGRNHVLLLLKMDITYHMRIDETVRNHIEIYLKLQCPSFLFGK